ncbi:Gfo/Idh/MocA family oxidoreductase [Aliishimia ponticola]|uniref:Gfo/Idh/MocA family oxidoreductase n=1 Tax=Aliishimia ponticola TaxID=2499833 RepID=A0A4S4N9J6_9RHOB|nr:Gfo/Idh/MocA family oxidoreductase [Aliishimia ponticola]THH35922.1 Gfo/Idh/MocA family oxidoreductase [Aliishimia ponticola]
MRPDLTCALIGLGMVADTHVAALRDAAGVRLGGVMGRDPAKARAFADRHGVPHVFDDIGQVAASDMDFVILATPPDARHDLVAALAQAGKPILMEKPIERDLPASRAIVDLCAAADVPLGMVFQHRTRRASRALKARIETGAMGDLVHAELRVPWWRPQSYYDAPGRGTYARDGGGVMLTQAIHTLDLALWLMGPVARLQAIMHRTPLHRLEAEDWAGALLRFESGAVGTLTATTAAYPGGSESVTIQGTKAAAHLAEGTLRLTHMDGCEETLGSAAQTGGGADPMAFTHAWHQRIIEDFAEALRDGRPPLATGQQALHAHAVIAAMEEASRSGAEVKL